MRRSYRQGSIILLLGAWSIFILGMESCSGKKSGEVLSRQGPYLGEPLPADSARVFAAGIVSAGMFTRDMAMMPDGKEIYFTVSLPNYSLATIVEVKNKETGWTAPFVPDFASDPRYDYIEPAISPDGQKLYFVSTRPLQGDGPATRDRNIWVMERTKDGWAEACPIGGPVNSDTSEYFPSLTKDGTLYFTRDIPSGPSFIYRAKMKNGRYETPERLPDQVNSGASSFNAFADPDDRFLIVPVYGRKDSQGSTDYYIVFHHSDDRWSDPVNLGSSINTPGGLEYSPYISPDKKYFFFMSTHFNRDRFIKMGKLNLDTIQESCQQEGNGNPSIYWISASFVDRLADLEKK